MKLFRKKAFTLAELLMAVFVISIIMVALAPVITRRMSDNIAIEVNSKKGLEIFTNPGSYTFDVPVGINTLFLQASGGGGGGGGTSYIDKSASFNDDAEWTAPKGVTQVTFTITGAGGGGGAGNGKTKSDTCEARTNKIPAMADNGQDLCVTRVTPIKNNGAGISVVEVGEQCAGNSCCWTNVDLGRTECNKEIRNEGVNCTQTVCTYGGMDYWCLISSAFPHLSWKANIKSGRLITPTEYERIVNQAPIYLGAQGLDLSWSPGIGINSPPVPLPITGMIYGCIGSSNNYCYDNTIYATDLPIAATGVGSGNGGTAYTASNQDRFHYTMELANSNAQQRTGIVLCVRNLDSREVYSGGGGASGAQYKKTVNVLPGDTFGITIGKGGAGGAANGGNGSRGDNTQIVHKRGSVTMGTYYVKGGLGGFGATNSAYGSTYSNGTADNQTTPLGTCYAQFRNTATGALTGGSTSCTINSFAGSIGNSTSGGGGGRVANTGTVTAGATLDNGQDGSKGVGFNATTFGFAGGGGYCPRGSGIACAKGGSGAGGKIDIAYRIMLPGAGGGSGTRVGGVNSANKAYEIVYKVSEGSRVVFEIGSGGVGGAVGQNGLSGTPTVIGDNEIIFLGGEGGGTVSQTQKDNLSSCIGTTTNSNTIASCLNNISYKPYSGEGSVVSKDGDIVTTTLGLVIKDASKVDYTVNGDFRGNSGNSSSQVSASVVPWTYGFDGGIGGAPFGIRQSSAAASISCGGGLSAVYGTITDVNNYVCTSGGINGNNARSHDPVNNEFGGSGGGGGGVLGDSFELGIGGNGSSGYLRIRWDESAQE